MSEASEITVKMVENGFTEIKDKVYPELLFFTKGHINNEGMLAIICMDPECCNVDYSIQSYHNFVEREDAKLRI